MLKSSRFTKASIPITTKVNKCYLFICKWLLMFIYICDALEIFFLKNKNILVKALSDMKHVWNILINTV